jgi:tetratricopeptide (TPR) repeat protein
MIRRLWTWLPVFLLFAALSTNSFAQTPPQVPETAEAYYHFALGQSLEGDGDWEAALDEYERALELDPTNSFIYSEMAASFLRHQQVRDAIDYAERAVRANRDNLDAHQLLSSVYTSLLTNTSGGRAVSREIVDRAVEELEEVVRLDATGRDAYLMLGRLYRFRDEPDRAAEIYRDFLEVSPGSEEGALALAELQLESGNVDEAIAILRDFSETQPASSAILTLLGEAYTRTEEWEAAADSLLEASTLDPENQDLLREAGRTLLIAGRVDEAATVYKNLIEIEPDDAVALLRLGQIERQRMNFANARAHLQRANTLVPNSPEILFDLALLERDEGNFEESLRQLQALLESTRRPNAQYTPAERTSRRVFLTNVALLETRLEAYDDAVGTFERMKDLTADRDGTIDVFIADTYRTAGRIDKALETCNLALDSFPTNRQLQLQRAELIAAQGRTEDALELLRAMAAANGDDFGIYSSIFSIYESARDFESAQGVLDEMTARFRDRADTYFLQGALYERQKLYAEAEAAFRSALAINANNPAVLNYLGYMLANNDTKLEEALEMLEIAVRTDPINGAYLDSLGWVYYRLERLDLAERFLTRAVIFSPKDPTLHEHLGDLYLMTGRPEEARASYLRSLELAEDAEERETVQEKLDAF